VNGGGGASLQISSSKFAHWLGWVWLAAASRHRLYARRSSALVHSKRLCFLTGCATSYLKIGERDEVEISEIIKGTHKFKACMTVG